MGDDACILCLRKFIKQDGDIMQFTQEQATLIQSLALGYLTGLGIGMIGNKYIKIKNKLRYRR